MYQKTVLNNGLRLITYAMPKMQSAALGIWIRIGGRDESKDIKGIAHFLEHLVFKGSRKYSCRQIKELIEGVGGALNGFTSEEATCYFAKLPATKQFQALDILADMVINPLLSQRDIEKERFVILEEIKMYKDLPQSYVQDVLEQLLWPGHSLGLPILGEKGTVLRLQHEDLASFQKNHYTPSNIVIAACGRLEHEKMIKKARSIFGGAKIKTKNTFICAPTYEKKPKLKLLKKKTAQMHLALGFYGINRDHPDKHALLLLHIILGANMSSRLFSEVREKRGLAYQIGTQVKGFTDTGIFLIQAGVDKAKIYQAIKVIIKELGKIKNKLVSTSELVRAKEFYIGQLRLALENTSDHMFWIGEPTLHLNKTYSFTTILKEIQGITAYDLRRIAKSIFRAEALRLALIGPLREGEEKLHACIKDL